jgi:uncharacterized protein YqhQ
MKQSFKTSIGGQAVIEGVMMRGPEVTALAVRTPDGSITTEQTQTAPAKAWYKKAPFVRGVFNMVSSLLVGYKYLMRSAALAGFEEEEPTKFEKWLTKAFGKSLSAVVAVVALVLGLAIAIGLFTVLPTVLVGLAARFIPSMVVRSLIEGLTKIVIFVLYLALVSRMPDIRRVFEYHGAEHKTIFCYEQGLPLTVENIRRQTRFHPRCGTSFLLIVLVVSILLSSAVTWSSMLVRVALKLALLPVVVGIAYEIIKFAGRHDNIVTRVISAPGLWLQRLTTSEPDDSQIEVAIASMEPVIPKASGTDQW